MKCCNFGNFTRNSVAKIMSLNIIEVHIKIVIQRQIFKIYRHLVTSGTLGTTENDHHTIRVYIMIQ